MPLSAVCFAAVAGLAETNPVCLAVVSFSAPAGNQGLQNAATILPDLLTSSLSKDNRSLLVERDRINALWNEWHLTEAGLTSADTVAKLGKALTCDWLVGGWLVQTRTGPQMWVKVIETQSSLVLDLQAMAYDPAEFAATARAVADSLA
ncbi:hypothetical protein SBV1_1690007 [Verrucomicrobia bacterium]|nr:hypothetical protein SBV1_1690007 [Verrucomicrobiota bacterium]